MRTRRAIEEFIDAQGNNRLEEGFLEMELGAEYNASGTSLTASRPARGPDAEAYDRGINGFQFESDGDQWWIVTLLWHEDDPIPECYQD